MHGNLGKVRIGGASKRVRENEMQEDTSSDSWDGRKEAGLAQ